MYKCDKHVPLSLECGGCPWGPQMLTPPAYLPHILFSMPYLQGACSCCTAVPLRKIINHRLIFQGFHLVLSAKLQTQ